MKKKTIVIGFGVSGQACAALLLQEGRSVLALDKRADEFKKDPKIERNSTSSGLGQSELFDRAGKRLQRGDLQILSDQIAIDWKQIEQVILSPGIPLTHNIVVQAIEQGIEVIGEIEFAFRHLRNPCIGITGTNGKTTVTLLIQHILQSAGKKAQALGNIGCSLSSYAMAPQDEEILVVELSSFQLETLRMKCLDVAAFLNLTPDHLDRYENLDTYAAAKCRIEECLKENGELWVSSQVAKEYGRMLRAPKIFDRAQAWENTTVATISPMRYIQLGVPERQNVQAAYPLCRFFGVTDAQFRRGLETFRKPKHRIEFVGEWNDIAFYNDSKATNIDSVMHAVGLFEGPIILLAGGVHKGASYRPWIEAFQGKVERIVAFGQAAALIQEDLQQDLPVDRVDTLEEAVVRAVSQAKKSTRILLSPGCSSFDQFRNYEHRGNEFKRIVEEKVWIERKRS